MKYLYKCDTCGEEKTVVHGMNEQPVVVCETCLLHFGESKMRKKITAPRTLFRGEWDTIDISKTHE